MANRSTEEYKTRDDEDESHELLEHQEEKISGKAQHMIDAYAENLQKKDPELLQEVFKSHHGEVHHSEATWITQPHTKERTTDVERFELLKESNAGKLFDAMDAAFKEHSIDRVESKEYQNEEITLTYIHKYMDAVHHGINGMVDELTNPITRALDEFEKDHPPSPEHHEIPSLLENMRKRDGEVHQSFRALFSPLHPSDEEYAANIQDLKDLSRDLSEFESRGGGTLGFGAELAARDPELMAELDLMARTTALPPPEHFSNAASWIKDDQKDLDIWRAFETADAWGNQHYSEVVSAELVELLFKPVSNESGDLLLEHPRTEPDCIRDEEFGRPDKQDLELYFNRRAEQGATMARDAMNALDEAGFNSAMDTLRQTAEELRFARAGSLPDGHRGEYEKRDYETLQALKYAEESAEINTERAAYMVIALSGGNGMEDLPGWNGDRETAAASDYFSGKTYDQSVVDPNFLEKFHGVTEGMLRGEQEQLVRYITERVVVQDDPEELYERLVHQTGDARMPG